MNNNDYVFVFSCLYDKQACLLDDFKIIDLEQIESLIECFPEEICFLIKNKSVYKTIYCSKCKIKLKDSEINNICSYYFCKLCFWGEENEH